MATTPHPFVKWAGGKKSVAQHVARRLPETIDTYYEPMVGGGFMFFYLARLSLFKRAVISDMNSELICAYTTIKYSADDLIAELRKSKYTYGKDAYLSMRAVNPEILSPMEISARFIYLNKTCFNGLYRVNKKGGFNTPFGKYKNPNIVDENNLYAVQRALSNVEVVRQDFAEACQNAKPGDAVYFDPPYIPVSKTSNYTSYTSDRFSFSEHQRLASLFKELGEKGIRTVLSNSVSPRSLELYKNFDVDLITGSRNIGGSASCREPVKEILAFTGPKDVVKNSEKTTKPLKKTESFSD